jgi:hypothetical protein
MAASPSPISPIVPIRFSKHLPFRSGADGIDVKGTTDPRLIAALAVPGTPFPPGEFPLAGIQISAQAGQDIVFDSGRGTVSFAASADAQSGLGIYLDPAHLLSDAAIDQYMGESFTLPSGPNTYYLLLSWGYGASASAKGSIALGAASVSFGAEGGATKKYAVIKRFIQNSNAAGAITDTLDSWTLPSVVKAPADLARDTWLFAETDGHFSASIGATYGYDFNWVREAKLRGLSGDIGLKIQLGVKASLGFEVSSSFAIVLSRESDQVLRLRVFKQPKKGWQFAFHAAAEVDPTVPQLPPNLDDFVLSVLDLHDQQLLKDLSDLRDWASGQAPLTGALTGIASRYMEQMLQTVYTSATGRPFDFEQAKALVLQFLNTWGGLDSKVASLIWKNILDQQVAGKMLDICEQIAACQTSADYIALVNRNVSQPTFLSTPAGQWLETIALGQILGPATSSDALAGLKNATAVAANFLKAGSSEQSILRALHSWIDPRINLKAVTKVADSVTLAQLDGWIRAKLQRFLDQSVLGLAEVQKVQKMIQLLNAKADSFYHHTRKALSDKYTFSFNEVYQSSSTSTALIDVEFDFAASGANLAALQQLFLSTMGGDFTDVLNTEAPGVKLNRALLSHELMRHHHLEIRLPFYHSTFDEVNQSLASANSVGSDHGRIFIYQLDAHDDIAAITNRGGSYSHLGLAASMPGRLNARTYGAPSFTYDYVYRAASVDMRRAQLQGQIGPYVDAYLRNAFAGNQVSYDTWLSDLDRAVDSQATDHYGHTLIELDIALKSEAVAQWLNAPSDSKSQAYMKMSLDMQRTGPKWLLPFYYFNDVSKYHDLGAASPLIVYSSIPAAVSVNSDTLQLTFRDVYWDYVDPGLRHKMILRESTRETLRNTLQSINRRLLAVGRKEAEFYAPEDGIINNMLRDALDDPRLIGLLQSESQMVNGARSAGLAMAKFRSSQGDPQAAIRAFAAWGADVTRTFNGFCSIYGGNALRPLGTMMFVTASASLGGQTFAPSALLRVGVLKPGVQFDDSQFLQGIWPSVDGLMLQQTIVSA